MVKVLDDSHKTWTIFRSNTFGESASLQIDTSYPRYKPPLPGGGGCWLLLGVVGGGVGGSVITLAASGVGRHRYCNNVYCRGRQRKKERSADRDVIGTHLRKCCRNWIDLKKRIFKLQTFALHRNNIVQLMN